MSALLRNGRGAWPTFVFLAVLTVSACGGETPMQPKPPTANPPRITCPVTVSEQSPSGQSTPVTYGSATAVDGTAPVTIACAPASGSLFPVGSTTVTCTATDAQQRTDRCTFPIVVTAPPRLATTRFLAFGDSITWGENGLATSIR